MTKKSELEARIKTLENKIDGLRSVVFELMRKTTNAAKCLIGTEEYNYFGGKCVECGETDICCLSLDHVNKDGKLDKISENGKRQVTPTWYAKLVKLIKLNKQLPRQLQLLCFNCRAKKDNRPWWI